MCHESSSIHDPIPYELLPVDVEVAVSFVVSTARNILKERNPRDITCTYENQKILQTATKTLQSNHPQPLPRKVSLNRPHHGR
jgi:hypothetical protein